MPQPRAHALTQTKVNNNHLFSIFSFFSAHSNTNRLLNYHRYFHIFEFIYIMRVNSIYSFRSYTVITISNNNYCCVTNKKYFGFSKEKKTGIKIAFNHHFPWWLQFHLIPIKLTRFLLYRFFGIAIVPYCNKETFLFWAYNILFSIFLLTREKKPYLDSTMFIEF